jgi:hypothetical protein
MQFTQKICCFCIESATACISSLNGIPHYLMYFPICNFTWTVQEVSNISTFTWNSGIWQLGPAARNPLSESNNSRELRKLFILHAQKDTHKYWWLLNYCQVIVLWTKMCPKKWRGFCISAQTTRVQLCKIQHLKKIVMFFYISGHESCRDRSKLPAIMLNPVILQYIFWVPAPLWEITQPRMIRKTW